MPTRRTPRPAIGYPRPATRGVLGRGMRPGTEAEPLAALLRADARAGRRDVEAAARDGYASWRRAGEVHASPPPWDRWIPDRHLSIPQMRVVETRTLPRPSPGGWPIRIPVRVAPVAQDRVVIDVDDLEPHVAEDAIRAGAAVLRVLAAEPDLAPGAAVVWTSPTGVQVHARLARTVGSAMVGSVAWRSWYAGLAERVLGALRAGGLRGGHADLAAGGWGRWSRLPGWRVSADDGSLVRARLVALSLPADEVPALGRWTTAALARWRDWRDGVLALG